MPATTLGLYIHIPFCARKCAYCDFYSLGGADRLKMDAYFAALLRHMRETAVFTGKKAGGGGWMVDSVYLGGGTPTLPGARRVVKLLSAARKLWQISQSAEITVEANPDTLDYKSLKTLRKAGVNRLSLGVQAVQTPLLETLGRVHSAEQAADCVREAQRAGFDNISVDLMYGIPGQTAEHLHDSLRAALSWNIQHLSLYGLKLEEGTPLYALEPPLPDDETQARQYLAAVDYLERHGFSQYEISNFSVPARQSRHNQKYWTLEPYIGFGPAAHSDFGGKRYSHARDLDAYIRNIEAGDAVVEEVDRIGPLERAGEYVMLGLRTVRGISGNEYTRLYKVSFDGIEKKLELLEKHGFARREGERWRLTAKGFLVSNRILSELLESEVDCELMS
ncbi:MAG: radical SAM family heme chaperone HemW [Oscillospiraceae bacterium]|nr:radical SAM family heme chaperone HemW [Oscillospiraceae bacterium]